MADEREWLLKPESFHVVDKPDGPSITLGVAFGPIPDEDLVVVPKPEPPEPSDKDDTMVSVEDVRLGRHTMVRLAHDNYVAWSTTTDSPCAWAMTREECIDLMRQASLMDDYDDRQLEKRIKRLDKTGVGSHSFVRTGTPEEYTSFNHAGPNGECLTFAALQRRYAGPGDNRDKFELQPGDIIPWED